MAKKQIINYTFTPGSNETFNAYPNAYTRLVNNKTYIQKMAVAYIQNQINNNISPFQDYEYNSAKCERDVGYVLEALINDIKFNGNVQIRYISTFYWNGDTPQVDGDRTPEVAVYNYLITLINSYIFPGVAASPAYQTAVPQNTSGSNGEAGANSRVTTLLGNLNSVITNGLSSVPALVSPNGFWGTITTRGKVTLTKTALIVNSTRGQILYNFADNTKTAYSIYKFLPDDLTTIYLFFTTSTMSASDEINIIYDEGSASMKPDPVYQDAVEKFRVSLPQSMMDTDFEYSAQGTKWESVELIQNYPSYFLKANEPAYTGSQITSITGLAAGGAGGSVTVNAGVPTNGTTGLSLLFSGDSDDSFVTVNLPFNIQFLGTTYNQLFVGTNGYISFGGGTGQIPGNNTNGNTPGLRHLGFFKGDRRLVTLYGAERTTGIYTLRWDGYNFGGSSANRTVVEFRFFANSNFIQLRYTTNANGSTFVVVGDGINSTAVASASVSSLTGYDVITTSGGSRNVRVVVASAPTTAFALGQPISLRETTNRTADSTGVIYNIVNTTTFDMRVSRFVVAGTTYNNANSTIYTGGFFQTAAISITSVQSIAGTTDAQINFSSPHSLFPGNSIFVVDTTQMTANHIGSFTVGTVISSTAIRYQTFNTTNYASTATISTGSTRVYIRPEGLPTHRFNDGGVSITTASSSPNAQIVRQTRRYFRYQSGKGIQFSTGVLFKPTYDISSVSVLNTTNPYTFIITTDQDHGFATPDQYRLGCPIYLSGFTVTSGVNTYNGYFRVDSIADARTFTVRLPSGTQPTDTSPGGVAKVLVQGWQDAVVRDGMFDDQNGLFFEHDGTDLFVVRRNTTTQLPGTVSVTNGSSNVIGTGTKWLTQLREGDYISIKGVSYIISQIVSDTELYTAPAIKSVTESNVRVLLTQDLRVRQSDFNLDKFDGKGPSGYIFDANRMQMVFMDYSWYGAGRARFGMRTLDGSIAYCHEFINNNVNTEAYMRSGNLPGRFEIYNRSKRGVLRSTLSTISTTFDMYDTDAADFPRIGRAAINWEVMRFTKGVPGSAGTINGISSTRFTIVQRNEYGLSTNATASIGDNIWSFNQNCGPSLSHWGVSVMMDGRFDEDKSYLFTAGTQNQIPIGSGAELPIVSVRLAPSVDNGIGDEFGRRSLINRSALTLKQVGIANTGFVQVTLKLNTESTLFTTQANWTRTGNGSISQYLDHSLRGTTPAPVAGDTLMSFFCEEGSSRFATTSFDINIIRELGNSILGGNVVYPDGPDVLTLYIRNLSNTSQNVRARISWTESQG